MTGKRARGIGRQMAALDPTMQGLLWSVASGALFVILNTLMRSLTISLDPFMAQFLRYIFGLIVMLPFLVRGGVAAFMPRNVMGQFTRGAVHTVGLYLWFVALPHISIAETTAIGFTGPIFIMLGAAMFLKEKMRWDRWVAALMGFVGVVVVVAPRLSLTGGYYTLVMLASAPMFAASFLITKSLTRYERATVIVLWQAISVSVLSAPLAFANWQPLTGWQWFGFVISGLLGSAGHYCLTRAYLATDISATQSVKFLELVWAAVLGWLVFSDQPAGTTLMGGVVIAAATVWIARREARRTTLPGPAQAQAQAQDQR